MPASLNQTLSTRRQTPLDPRLLTKVCSTKYWLYPIGKQMMGDFSRENRQ